MEIDKISKFSDFLGNVDYPAVIFCEDGEVLSINNVALKLLGRSVESITMEPDKFMSSDDFWPTLEKKKVIIWHRLLLKVNRKNRFVVSGFVNQFEYNDKKAYMVLFELRSDVTIGSVSLERIINHVGVLALYLYRPDGVWQTRYVTKNVVDYGYEEKDFYNGTTGLSDLMVKSDYDILIGNIYKAYNVHSNDFEMKTRMLTGNNSIISVTLKCHIVTTTSGEADGIEFLFIHNKQSDFEGNQNSYIMSIMNKIKSFAMVQIIENGNSVLKYITPNAKSMGLNVEALKQGNKLFTDYIHPEDRKRVTQNEKNTVKLGKSDYEDEFRIVDDAGVVKWVKSQNSITQSENNTYTVEFFVTDITENKRLEESVVEAKQKFEDKLSYIMNDGAEDLPDENMIIGMDKEQWSDLVKEFSSVSGLYSTIISTEGKQIVEPAGPNEHIGVFYDLFEKPQYLDICRKLNQTILQNNVPVIMEMDDGIDGSYICGAPVMVGDHHIATWILCSYDKDDLIKMKKSYKIQWKLCSIFSEYMYHSKVLKKEAMRSKSVEMLLEEKIRRQKILTEALNAMDDDVTIDKIIAMAGEYLGSDVVALYRKDESQKNFCHAIWSKNSSMSAEEYIEEWQKGRNKIKASRINDGKNAQMIIFDQTHFSKEVQQEVAKGPVKSFAALSIDINDVQSGWLVMANTVSHKIWTSEELEFAQDIRNVICGILTRIEGDGNIRVVNKLLIDTYNYLNVGIFIKDAVTDLVLFSNESLNEKLGFDFTGKDSKMLVRNINDPYKGMDAMSRPYMEQKKQTSWRSYIRQFDKIMDLSEVSMKWLDGRKATLVILREAQD